MNITLNFMGIALVDFNKKLGDGVPARICELYKTMHADSIYSNPYWRTIAENGISRIFYFPFIYDEE